LYKENYYKGVEGFSNLIFSNPKNISEGEIRCSCVKCKNKKIHQADIVMMHLLKKSLYRNTNVGLHTTYKTML
jgi:hypothetical protein